MRVLTLYFIVSGMVVATLPGCATTFPSAQTTGSIAPLPSQKKPIEQMDANELAMAADRIGTAYGANPKDRNAGLHYANLLRMTGKNAQALAVMQQVAIQNPADREVLSAFGKAQAGAGHLEQALDTIRRAQTPDRPPIGNLNRPNGLLPVLWT